jgi:ribosome modulation factor
VPRSWTGCVWYGESRTTCPFQRLVALSRWPGTCRLHGGKAASQRDR